MRLLLLSALLLNTVSVSAEPLAPVGKSSAKKCLGVTSHFAREGSMYRGQPAKPRKLTELPPADTYAAVYRIVDGCPVPVMYREVRAVRSRK